MLTLLRIGWMNLKRDRVAQALTFLLPILFFSIFASVFGGRAIEHAAVVAVDAQPQRLLLLQRRNHPPGELGAILVSKSDRHPRRGIAAAAAEDAGEDRKKEDRQEERQRLRDAIALEVRPAHAQEGRNHSLNSLPVR